MKTRLATLCEGEEAEVLCGSLDAEVTGVATDSRLVEPGNLFVCLPGYRAEGGEALADRHQFAEQAQRRGAVAFFVERAVDVDGDCTVVRVADTWRAAALAASRFHGRPSQSLTVVGITGTSGKTSTSYFVDAVLAAAGHSVARFGTIDYRFGDTVLVAEQTTPESPVVHGLLRRAADAGSTAAVMEVSSHALELERVGDVSFDVGVFTNLSRDHLNFHPDMASYRAAKAKLFESLEEGAAAVINADDEASQSMLAVSRARSIQYGLATSADVVASEIDTTLDGLRFRVDAPSGKADVRLSQLGDYNVHNALAAIAVGVALDSDIEVLAAAVGDADSVPGRFEVVGSAPDPVVVVDYAHKPAALERLLVSARRLQPKRLITVFGCGGDRDRGKRRVMGAAAGEVSDLVVVTSDNPRGEDPQRIIEDILAGSRRADPTLERHLVEPDRAAAIRRAIEMAEPGDMVVVAGKGHEPYQLVAGVKHDFDDREHARAVLSERQRPQRG